MGLGQRPRERRHTQHRPKVRQQPPEPREMPPTAGWRFVGWDYFRAMRIPLVSGWGPWVRSGGFMSYGPDLDVLAGYDGSYVGATERAAVPTTNHPAPS